MTSIGSSWSSARKHNCIFGLWSSALGSNWSSALGYERLTIFESSALSSSALGLNWIHMFGYAAMVMFDSAQLPYSWMRTQYHLLPPHVQCPTVATMSTCCLLMLNALLCDNGQLFIRGGVCYPHYICSCWMPSCRDNEHVVTCTQLRWCAAHRQTAHSSQPGGTPPPAEVGR